MVFDALSPSTTTRANSEMDDSPTRPEKDPRTSLHHLLDNNPISRTSTPPVSRPTDAGTITTTNPNEMTDDDEVKTPRVPALGLGLAAAAVSASTSASAAQSKPAASNNSRKRKEPLMNVITNSNYVGNKIKHLKKDDGEPLWRRDIQYDFLKAVFDNDRKVFTNSYDPSPLKQSFADLYIDTMARSTKTSKILRDKLFSEHEPAKNMAMVCLLVNLGRMNTTLNFFPEMRAQLRTYHAIPSLQAHQDPNSYKQLQDAPRLKSILKGASEDRREPNSLEKIKTTAIPRTNPVNLIFVLAQFAPKVTELHFPPERDFYDILMAEDVSSESRATAFLWLMWFYLESDFTEEGADENPFGPGIDYDLDVRNQGVPRYKFLTAEEQAEENVDTPEELEYGLSKQRERKRIIEADQATFTGELGPPKRGPKPKLHLPLDEGGPSPASLLGRHMKPKYESDMDSTRSTPPPRSLGGMRIQSVLNAGKSRGGLKNQIAEGSSPTGHHVGEPVMRRSRPLTQHQIRVQQHHNQRVNHILSRGLRAQHHVSKKRRTNDGALWRSYQRTERMTDPLDDSEDEASLMKPAFPFKERGMGGLVQLAEEEDDFGEELAAYGKAFRRMIRRLDRWEANKDPNFGVMGTNRVNGNGAEQNNDETEDEQPAERGQNPKPRANGHARMDREEDLDDMDKEILGMEGDEGEGEAEAEGEGEGEGEGDADEDEDLDDDEKELLNLGDVIETDFENSDGMDVD